MQKKEETQKFYYYVLTVVVDMLIRKMGKEKTSDAPPSNMHCTNTFTKSEILKSLRLESLRIPRTQPTWGWRSDRTLQVKKAAVPINAVRF